MAEQEFVFDLYTLFGPLPSRGDTDPGGLEGLQALLARQRVAGAATLATVAVYADAAAGNKATLEACQAAGGRFVPAALLDPRAPLTPVTGARIVYLLPATQGYPLPYAPVADCLRAAQAAGLPVFAEARRPGDATAFGAAIREVGYAGAPVILGGVGQDTLYEAVSVARASDRVGLATNGMAGIGEVRYAAQALGVGRLFFASGAPLASAGAASAAVKLSGLQAPERAQVFGENARRLLGLGG